MLQRRSARQINPTLNTVKSADDLLILAKSQANEHNGEQKYFEKNNKDVSNEQHNKETISKTEIIIRQNL